MAHTLEKILTVLAITAAISTTPTSNIKANEVSADIVKSGQTFVVHAYGAQDPQYCDGVIGAWQFECKNSSYLAIVEDQSGNRWDILDIGVDGSIDKARYLTPETLAQHPSSDIFGDEDYLYPTNIPDAIKDLSSKILNEVFSEYLNKTNEVFSANMDKFEYRPAEKVVEGAQITKVGMFVFQRKNTTANLPELVAVTSNGMFSYVDANVSIEVLPEYKPFKQIEQTKQLFREMEKMYAASKTK